MNPAEHWSDRRSDRIERGAAFLPGHEATAANSAPESMSLAAGVSRPPRSCPERTSHRRLRQLTLTLSERDRRILADLDRFRFLTGSQLQYLHFHDHKTTSAATRICRRTLARLAAHRLITHLDRRIGGLHAGSSGYVWRLGVVGDRLLRQSRGDGGRARHKEPSARHLGHCLAVADCHLQLVDLGRRGEAELLDVETEPTCWRRFLGNGGQHETLKPDLFAVTASGDYEDHWFVEVDRATESLPTLLRKCGQYERYRRSGQEQQNGGVFPRVVWVVPDERRQARLLAGLRATRHLDSELFRVVRSDDLPALVTGGAS